MQGFVTDASTGQPIPYVQIYLPDSEQGTLTDENGRFTLEGVPEGTRTVYGIMPGFGEVAQKARVTSQGPAEVTFQLRPEAILLERLVVRGGS